MVEDCADNLLSKKLNLVEIKVDRSQSGED